MHINMMCNFIAIGLINCVDNGGIITPELVNDLLAHNGGKYRRGKTFEDIMEVFNADYGNFDDIKFASLNSQIAYHLLPVIKLSHRYQKGDKVLVVSQRPHKYSLWCDGMTPYMNRVVTIAECSKDFHIYLIVEDGHRYAWSDEMFVQKVE